MVSGEPRNLDVRLNFDLFKEYSAAKLRVESQAISTPVGEERPGERTLQAVLLDVSKLGASLGDYSSRTKF